VECYQNYIHYTDPIRGSSSNLQSNATDLGTIGRNESRTFSCPQVVTDITIVPRVLTPEEIKQMYQAGVQSLNETGYPPGEDMPFDWADFEFHIKYSPWILPIRWTQKYRVVGKPAEGGNFVWQQVATDYQFEPFHKTALPLY
jgi:hypothetical protein